MPTTVSAGFNTYLSRMTPSASAVAAAAKHRQSVSDALAPLGLTRFFQTGSFSHGTGVHPYSDVDYLAGFGSPQPATSDAALVAVRNRLTVAFPYTVIQVRRPAVVLRFAGGAEIFEVVPAWHKRTVGGHLVFAIPGASSGWIESAPRAHSDYVTNCNTSVGDGKAKGLARLAKAWKYERAVPVSSFYLEMRAARHALNNKPVIYDFDLLSLLKDLRGFAAMNDPSGLVGRIYSSSSETLKTDSLSKLETAIGRAQKARDADAVGDTASAFSWWDKVFNGSFPAYG